MYNDYMKKYIKLEYISISVVFVTLFSLIKTYFYWLEYSLNIFNYIQPGEVIFTSINSLYAIVLILLSPSFFQADSINRKIIQN